MSDHVCFRSHYEQCIMHCPQCGWIGLSGETLDSHPNYFCSCCTTVVGEGRHKAFENETQCECYEAKLSPEQKILLVKSLGIEIPKSGSSAVYEDEP